MAEKLKRDYDIIVLKVEFIEAPRGAPDLLFTLQYKVDGRLTTDELSRAASGDLGLRTRTERSSTQSPPGSITLPQALLEKLHSWLAEETKRDRPLWIHLVKPYGVLRFVPWERLLGETLQVPILMLPDFIFPPPREVSSVLEVAVCGSAPLGHEGGSVGAALHAAVARIREASPRRTRIHAFVDAEFADWFRAEWVDGLSNGDIVLYDQVGAARYVEQDLSSRVLDHAGRLRSPWLLWMREALSGRSIDVVHFIGHGYLSYDQGAMLFAQSPLERTNRYLAGPVGAAELQTFLTQVGAWSTVFSCVEYNNSEAGIRALADEIAQSRPGPMMMHTMEHDQNAEALGAGYRFLYGRTREPPPKSAALFIYCQPYLDERASPPTRGRRRASSARRQAALPELSRNRAQRAEINRSLEASPLDSLFHVDDNVATWVASTERFAEQVQLHYQELARDEVLPAEVHEHNARVVNDTIDRIRSAVAAAASAQPGSPGGALPPIELDDRGEPEPTGGVA